jgi:hypothetical protein
MSYPAPTQTRDGAWYDEDANPITIHGPFAGGIPAARADAQTSGATSPICFPWAERATVETQLGI